MACVYDKIIGVVDKGMGGLVGPQGNPSYCSLASGAGESGKSTFVKQMK